MLLLIFIYLVSCVLCRSNIRDEQNDNNEHCVMENCADFENMQCLARENTADCFYRRKDLMTDELIDEIVDTINEERKRLASGDKDMRTGSESEELPQAKFMHEVRWDDELQAMAQSYADRCDKHIDTMNEYLKTMCMKTKSYEDTDLISGEKIPYTFEEKEDHRHLTPEPKARTINMRSEAFFITSHEFVPSGAQQVVIGTLLKKWLDGKTSTTASVVKSYLQDDTTKDFLRLMAGDMTDIGCYLSAYKEYNHTSSTNRLPVVLDFQCVVSQKLSNSKSVYCFDATDKTDLKCNCAKGYREEDNLCKPTSAKQKIPCQEKTPCRPLMALLLPIIKEINAPEEMQQLTTKPERRWMKPHNKMYMRRNLNDSSNFQFHMQGYLPTPQPKPIKSVAPRKNFSHLKELVEQYMSRRHGPTGLTTTPRTTTPPTTTTVPSVGDRFKFDDVDKLLGALRPARRKT